MYGAFNRFHRSAAAGSTFAPLRACASSNVRQFRNDQIHISGNCFTIYLNPKQLYFAEIDMMRKALNHWTLIAVSASVVCIQLQHQMEMSSTRAADSACK